MEMIGRAFKRLKNRDKMARWRHSGAFRRDAPGIRR